ncbi:hypothetical protein [Derxia lacustris]|uniref:hypothetical protein n=1 Tax=Derxia lacustris TaxID=764842 RepID=UPI000A16F0E0|nr:hypothetical protein [Derxia lacustris]
MSSTPEGYFIDWDGNIRDANDPGNGFHTEVDKVAKYVAVKHKGGTLMHEATFYPTLEAIEKKGIKAQFVPSSQPWGLQD